MFPSKNGILLQSLTMYDSRKRFNLNIEELYSLSVPYNISLIVEDILKYIRLNVNEDSGKQVCLQKDVSPRLVQYHQDLVKDVKLYQLFLANGYSADNRKFNHSVPAFTILRDLSDAYGFQVRAFVTQQETNTTPSTHMKSNMDITSQESPGAMFDLGRDVDSGRSFLSNYQGHELAKQEREPAVMKSFRDTYIGRGFDILNSDLLDDECSQHQLLKTPIKQPEEAVRLVGSGAGYAMYKITTDIEPQVKENTITSEEDREYDEEVDEYDSEYIDDERKRGQITPVKYTSSGRKCRPNSDQQNYYYYNDENQQIGNKRRNNKQYQTPMKRPRYNDDLSDSGKKNKRKDRGLKILSEQVKDLLIKKKVTTFSQVSNELIKILKIDNQKEKNNVKRRVYDALNVLIASGFLGREGKKDVKFMGVEFMAQSIEAMGLSFNRGKDKPSFSPQEINKKKNLLKQLQEKYDKKVEQLQDVMSSLVAKKHLVMRNRKQKVKQRLNIPFIFVTSVNDDNEVRKQYQVNVMYNEDQTRVAIKMKQKMDLIGDTEVLIKLKMHKVNKDLYKKFLEGSKAFQYVDEDLFY